MIKKKFFFNFSIPFFSEKLKNLEFSSYSLLVIQKKNSKNSGFTSTMNKFFLQKGDGFLYVFFHSRCNKMIEIFHGNWAMTETEKNFFFSVSITFWKGKITISKFAKPMTDVSSKPKLPANFSHVLLFLLPPLILCAVQHVVFAVYKPIKRCLETRWPIG